MAKPVFDREQLLRRVGDDIALLTEVFEDFVDDVAERMAFARRAVEVDDETRLQEHAHALKGCLSALASVRAWELANLLEGVASGQGEGDAKRLLDALETEFEVLFDGIRALIDELS